MTPTEIVLAQVLAGACEAMFLGGAVWVWRALMEMGVNGPCQLGIGLLVALRLSAATSALGTGGLPPLDLTWLVGAAFSFLFLYTLYHMGVLIAACRR
ncbi:MAG: hypothetical protein GX131_08655 [candidate division WS1 bacterium]|jgi:hypothetical protein|nr:hypothetical protein [candidate division WS1 bacterium]